MGAAGNATHCEPWNKGKIVGQKAPFNLKDIWALRVRLQMRLRGLSGARDEFLLAAAAQNLRRMA